MSIEDIKRRITAIEAEVDLGDHEKAHSLEDKLRADFIAYVAKDGASDALINIKAGMVLTTDKIEFARWCA